MRYTFYWLDGKRDVFEGETPAEALTGAGYGNGALRALDFCAPGDDAKYWRDESKKYWTNKQITPEPLNK